MQNKYVPLHQENKQIINNLKIYIMATFITDLKSKIIEKLNDYKGVRTYLCDLSGLLFESENVNGSVFCNSYKTKEFIKENFDLFGQLVEYAKDNMGINLNPFNEPEKAHVWLLLEASQSLLSQCKTVDKFWNDEREIDDELINSITEELNSLNVDEDNLF